MICKNCGKEIYDGNKFCPFCGEKVLTEEYIENNVIADELPQVLGMSEISKQDSSFESTDAHNIKPKQKNNSSKGKGVIVGVIAILVVVICAGIFIVNSNRKNIDVDLIEIMYEPEFAGYEGEGVLANVACVDEDKIDLYLSQIEDNQRAAEVKEFLLSVEFNASKTQNLKSGDKVEFTAFYDESLAKKLKLNIINSSATVKVELDTDPSLYLEKASSLYKEIISEAIEMYPDDNGCYYQLYDIDGNGVPELFILLGTCEADYMYYVYQVIHDEAEDEYDASCIGSFPGGYTMVYGTDEKNAFVTVRNHQGYIRVAKVHFSEGSLNEEELFSGDMMECDDDTVTEEVCIYGLNEYSGINSMIN